MKQLLIIGLLTVNLVFGQTKYQKDFNQFWTDVNENYAYFEQQNINWGKVKEIYSPQADTITNMNSFIKLLERMTYELHNGHISLNLNLDSSNRIIPSGLDMYVENINGKFIITDLRKGFKAEQCGLKIGMEIVLFNGKTISEQLNQFLPKYAINYSSDMYQYAISMLFAGTHNKERIITVKKDENEINFYPDKSKNIANKELVEYKMLNNNVGYIKINNSLGNSDLINLFDKVIDSLFLTKNLIIDLTETPSGGNTTVGRAIMGRFIEKKLPYQQHEYNEFGFDTKRSWVEYVTPRHNTYKGKVIIMVGHWTGSMGEGIAIGFDGMKKGLVVGTEMAKLFGAINGTELKETKIGFQFPTERLYHINGTPRELFIPKIMTNNGYETWDKVVEILKIK